MPSTCFACCLAPVEVAISFHHHSPFMLCTVTCRIVACFRVAKAAGSYLRVHFKVRPLCRRDSTIMTSHQHRSARRLHGALCCRLPWHSVPFEVQFGRQCAVPPPGGHLHARPECQSNVRCCRQQRRRMGVACVAMATSARIRTLAFARTWYNFAYAFYFPPFVVASVFPLPRTPWKPPTPSRACP